MACVKQMACKSIGGASPCLHLATKATQAAAQKAIAVRNPHSWRPETVVGRKTRKFQKITDLLIRKATFQCLVQEIVEQVCRKSDL